MARAGFAKRVASFNIRSLPEMPDQLLLQADPVQLPLLLLPSTWYVRLCTVSRVVRARSTANCLHDRETTYSYTGKLHKGSDERRQLRACPCGVVVLQSNSLGHSRRPCTWASPSASWAELAGTRKHDTTAGRCGHRSRPVKAGHLPPLYLYNNGNLHDLRVHKRKCTHPVPF